MSNGEHPRVARKGMTRRGSLAILLAVTRGARRTRYINWIFLQRQIGYVGIRLGIRPPLKGAADGAELTSAGDSTDAAVESAYRRVRRGDARLSDMDASRAWRQEDMS
jgi:hypothetical protein